MVIVIAFLSPNWGLGSEVRDDPGLYVSFSSDLLCTSGRGIRDWVLVEFSLFTFVYRTWAIEDSFPGDSFGWAEL